MAAKKTLNLAMIGHGFMGRAHSNAFRQVNPFFDTAFNLNLKVLCGHDENKLHPMAERWGWSETATDWREVVARKDIDIVDIATPNRSHAEIAIAAAEAGKIVFCEKPLAMNVAEAERMAKAVTGRQNLVWFNYRRVPAVMLAKRFLDEGRLGDIFHYRGLYLNSSGLNKSGGWRYDKAAAGSGASGDLLSHLLDLALWLNGPLKELCATLKTFVPGREVDDAVLLLAHFINGSIGTFEATRYGTGNRNRNLFEIHGSKGAVSFDLGDMNRLKFFEVDGPEELHGARTILVAGPGHPYFGKFWPPGHTIGFEHTFIATLADFLQTLEEGTEFHANFEDGLRVQKLLEAVGKSAETRAWVAL
ncbi:MAG TPA: Gfo/Idh/MocA family oxidoreductase [Candidatus Koribacter sp.]|jgi:predicted dehydrogenase